MKVKRASDKIVTARMTDGVDCYFIDRVEPCKSCGGTGLYLDKACKNCGGTGTVNLWRKQP